MARKIVIKTDSSRTILVETRAEDELELQELVKEHPDLLPVEEFDMTGPLLVVGRETSLQSGAVDLVAIARSGELLIVEFKTGPQNTDFRHALAQLFDYGSDVWSMSYENFEAAVAVRYFQSAHCKDDRVKRLNSLQEAATAIWPDMTEDEFGNVRERLVKQLVSGSFSYILVAQRFTDTIQRTAQYLNEILAGPRAYAVELVRFDGDGISAFETRTIVRPIPRTTSPAEYLDEGKFYERVTDGPYKEFLRELFEVCRGLGYRFEWGTSGVSVRLPTPDRPEPLTVLWVFQPGRSGWMGLTDLNFGYDAWSADRAPSVRPALEQYLGAVRQLEGSDSVKAKNLRDTVATLTPACAIQHSAAIREILAGLISADSE